MRSPKIARVVSIALGSWTMTVAPSASSASISDDAPGLSRMSSVSALNARPQTATVRPAGAAAQRALELGERHALLAVVDRLDRLERSGTSPNCRAE